MSNDVLTPPQEIQRLREVLEKAVDLLREGDVSGDPEDVFAVVIAEADAALALAGAQRKTTDLTGVRRTCEKCRGSGDSHRYDLDPFDQAIKGGGCSSCQGTGYVSLAGALALAGAQPQPASDNDDQVNRLVHRVVYLEAELKSRGFDVPDAIQVVNIQPSGPLPAVIKIQPQPASPPSGEVNP